MLNTSEHVTVINSSNLFRDYDKMFDMFYKIPKTGTVKTNHLFTFSKYSYDVNSLIMKTKISLADKEEKTEDLLLIHKQKTPTERKVDLLRAVPDPLEKPGLALIKQIQLYTKWRKVLPPKFQDITFPEPSHEIIIQSKRDKKKNRDHGKTTEVEDTAEV